MKSFHMDLISSCQSALNYYNSYFSKCLCTSTQGIHRPHSTTTAQLRNAPDLLLCFTKESPRFQMINNKCHNWVRLKTPSTLQSIRMNRKTMMGRVVCAVDQSVNPSCFKAQTCERSAGPTLLGLQDSAAAITSAARIQVIHLCS